MAAPFSPPPVRHFKPGYLPAGEPERWPRRPVVLPEGCEAIECGRIHVRGERSRLTARHGAERASIERAD